MRARRGVILLLIVVVCGAGLAGCTQAPTATSMDEDPTLETSDSDGFGIRQFEDFADPRDLANGIELNVTGPIGLRFGLRIAEQDDCELTIALEYRTAALGLSYMAIKQEETSTGTGQAMVDQESAVDAGPIDNREEAEPKDGASRITWSIGPGDSTLTIAILDAQPHDSDFVANGSVRLDSTCKNSDAKLSHAGNQIALWHAQNTNGTAMVSHMGMGFALDRQVQATFDAERTVLVAFSSGQTVGQVSFSGPETNVQATLPLQRVATAEGGPGTYATSINVTGGTGVWGFMAGLDPIQA